MLPPADAIVNPKMRGCRYPFPGICGGMVAYKLVQVLFEECGVPMEEWLDMLEIAAIATVGDVMKLQGENRIIVKEGLCRLGHTSNLGLRKLIEKITWQRTPLRPTISALSSDPASMPADGFRPPSWLWGFCSVRMRRRRTAWPRNLRSLTTRGRI